VVPLPDARATWLEESLRIAAPVLNALSQQRLRETLPLQMNPARAPYAPLQAFAGILAGIAPWLELEKVKGREKTLQATYRAKVLECLDAATDPGSKDRMLFSGGDLGQPLADAAFLSLGLLRAPTALVSALSVRVRGNLVGALKETRFIMPKDGHGNLYPVMVEAALALLGEKELHLKNVEDIVAYFKCRYVGSGLYIDGESLLLDYANSLFIHPMLFELLSFFKTTLPYCRNELPLVLERARVYAGMLERLISQDGTFPVSGSYAVCRFGVFHLLSLAALMGFLPETVTPAQVRCALMKVTERVMHCPIFDSRGFLLPGLYGYQPGMTAGHATIGTFYRCMMVYLPLGLPANAAFWRDADVLWTHLKIVGGEDVSADALSVD